MPFSPRLFVAPLLLKHGHLEPNESGKQEYVMRVSSERETSHVVEPIGPPDPNFFFVVEDRSGEPVYINVDADKPQAGELILECLDPKSQPLVIPREVV